MTWCRDWAKPGLGCRVSGGVLSAYSPRQLLDVSPVAPPFYPWERISVNMARAFSWSHSGPRDCRRSQTATCIGKGCHHNNCLRECAGVSFCPTSVAVHVMAAQYCCLQTDTCGTVTGLSLHLVLCTEPERFVADCWCAFVRFSSVPGTSQGSPLNTLLGFAQYH